MNEGRSFQGLLDQARAELDHPRPATKPDGLIEAGLWWSEQRVRLRRSRWIAFLGATAYMVVFTLVGMRLWVAFRELPAREADTEGNVWGTALELAFAGVLPLLAMLGALWIAHRRGTTAQIVARSMLWGMTMIVIVFQWMLSQLDVGSSLHSWLLPLEASAVLVANLTCTGALLALGNHGLRPPGSDDLRGLDSLLTLSLVMGLADALVLLTVGSLFASKLVPLLLTVWLVVAAYGLHRRRTWGLLAMAAGNVAELLLAGTEAFEGLGPFVLVLILTSALQILIPLPVYFAMVRRRARPLPVRRWIRKMPEVVLVTSAGIAVVQWVMALAESLGHLSS